jgi:MFS family permease
MNGVPGPADKPLVQTLPERPTWVRWRILALLFAYSFMSWFNRVSMSVAGDEYIMKEYGISETKMGIVYSALLFTYTIFMTPGGWFIDRFGGWTALVIMGFGSALFGMLTGMVGWFVVSGIGLWLALIVIRGFMGVFTAPIYPGSGQINSRWFPFPQQALANGLVIGAALVGIASTFEGFGSLIDWFGWENAFLISGAVTALLALVWLAYARGHPSQHPSVNQAERDLILFGQTVPPSRAPSSIAITAKPGWPDVPLKDLAPHEEERLLETGITKDKSSEFMAEPSEHISATPDSASASSGGTSHLKGALPETKLPGRPFSGFGSWLPLLRNRSLVLLTISYAAVGYFEYLFYFWIRHYFDKVLELDKEDSRLAATVANLAMAVGMFLGGWLSDLAMRRYGYRIGRALVPVVGLTASAGLLFLGLWATEPVWVVVWFSLAMASVGASEGPFWATAIDLGGKRGGTSAGIFNTGGNAGGILSPVVTPLVSKFWGWQVGVSLGSVACLVGVTLWFWIDPRERCPED